MRKFWSILLLMVLMTALVLPVSAAGSSVTLLPSVASLQAGDTFTVEAVLENSDKISLGTVALHYDESALELTGGVCQVTGTTIGQVLPNKKAGTFLLAMPKKVSGTLFLFTFWVKTDAAPGAYEITAQAAVGTTGGNYIDVTGARITVGDGNAQPGQNTEETTKNTVGGIQQSQSNPPVQSATEGVAPVVQTSPEKNSSLWWLLLILPVAACIAGIVIFRKKKV